MPTISKIKFESYGHDKGEGWSLIQLQNIAAQFKVSRKGTKQEIFERIMDAWDPSVQIEVLELPTQQQAVRPPSPGGGCYRENRPVNGVCPPNKPYMTKTERGDCCYAKPRFQSLKMIQHNIGEKHEAQFKSLVEQGILRKRLEPWEMELTLERFKNFKIIVYDLETTGRPTRDNVPDITQIAMYCANTREFYATYIKPLQPIDKVASQITGIYYTFDNQGGFVGYNNTWVNSNPFMNSGEYNAVRDELFPTAKKEQDVQIQLLQRSMSYDFTVQYLMSRGMSSLGYFLNDIKAYIRTVPDFRNAVEMTRGMISEDELLVDYINSLQMNGYYMYQFITSMPEELRNRLQSYIYQTNVNQIKREFIDKNHDRITKEVVRRHGLHSVEKEKTFSETVDEIDKFIKKGADKDTIIFMVAHNGNSFDEPILRDEYGRVNKEFYLGDNVIFVDTYMMALTWIERVNVENYKLGTLYRKFLNEELVDAHDAKADVEGLWKVTKGMFKEVWGRDDLPFIAYKFLEFFYTSQLINVEYQKQIINKIFAHKEFEMLGMKKPTRIMY